MFASGLACQENLLSGAAPEFTTQALTSGQEKKAESILLQIIIKNLFWSLGVDDDVSVDVDADFFPYNFCFNNTVYTSGMGDYLCL